MEAVWCSSLPSITEFLPSSFQRVRACCIPASSLSSQESGEHARLEPTTTALSPLLLLILVSPLVLPVRSGAANPYNSATQNTAPEFWTSRTRSSTSPVYSPIYIALSSLFSCHLPWWKPKIYVINKKKSSPLFLSSRPQASVFLCGEPEPWGHNHFLHWGFCHSASWNKAVRTTSKSLQHLCYCVMLYVTSAENAVSSPALWAQRSELSQVLRKLIPRIPDSRHQLEARPGYQDLEEGCGASPTLPCRQGTSPKLACRSNHSCSPQLLFHSLLPWFLLFLLLLIFKYFLLEVACGFRYRFRGIKPGQDN